MTSSSYQEAFGGCNAYATHTQRNSSYQYGHISKVGHKVSHLRDELSHELSHGYIILETSYITG